MSHILIVDDSSLVRLHLSQVLTRAGYAASAVTSGKAAIASYQTERADLVILDAVMPDMDGAETLLALQKIDSQVKVLGISGMGPRFPTLYLDTLRMLGARGTLEKPFSDEALLLMVKQTIGSAGSSDPQVAA